MLGTWINAGAILLGGLLGLAGRGQAAPRTQVALKGILGVLLVFTGLGVSWSGLASGGVGRFGQHLLIAIVAMTLGKLTGQRLRLQAGVNRLGRHAGEILAGADGTRRPTWSQGFLACTILYCLAPLAFYGAVLDGVNGHWQTLALKAAMDGLAGMAFAGTFGWSALAAVVPVVALQGSLTLAVRSLAPHVLSPAMTDCLLATSGLLVFCVALLVLEIRKIELADYLPSLVWAPFLAWVWP